MANETSDARTVAEFLKALRDATSADEAHDLLVSDHAEEVEAAAGRLAGLEYTYEHLEAAACMWEHVLTKLRGNWTYWIDYRDAHGMAELRAVVIRHAPKLETAYLEAVKNGYDKDFDWDFVPQYMESHIAAILT